MKWLEEYLIAQKNITCLVISHDSGYVQCNFSVQGRSLYVPVRFLDTVTTDIIHYESKKVRVDRLSGERRD